MSGRVVLVTGATSGIGSAIADRFASAGDTVVIHGRSRDRGEAVRARIRDRWPTSRTHLILGDLCEPRSCSRVVDETADVGGAIDVLVNNAGTNVFCGVRQTTESDWQTALDLDLRAAWLCAKAAITHMARGSAIVNVASNHADATVPGAFPYNVAKAGLIALTRSLAIKPADVGIRANAVCPGWVDTPLADAYFAASADPPGERRRVAALHPVGRIGTPDDVASAVAFLASADAGFITGTSLLVDGGRSALLEDPRSG